MSMYWPTKMDILSLFTFFSFVLWHIYQALSLYAYKLNFTSFSRCKFHLLSSTSSQVTGQIFNNICKGKIPIRFQSAITIIL